MRHRTARCAELSGLRPALGARLGARRAAPVLSRVKFRACAFTEQSSLAHLRASFFVAREDRGRVTASRCVPEPNRRLLGTGRCPASRRSLSSTPRSKVPLTEGCRQGDYVVGEPFTMADGLEQNAEFFDLTYEDSARVSLGCRFTTIALCYGCAQTRSALESTS